MLQTVRESPCHENAQAQQAHASCHMPGGAAAVILLHAVPGPAAAVQLVIKYILCMRL